MSKTDSLLKKAAFFEKLALYGGRKDFLQAIAQEGPLTSTPGFQGSTMVGDSGEQSTPAPAYPYIDPDIQDLLNRVLDMKIRPIRSDGKLGPQTREALQKFKELYGNKPVTKDTLAQILKDQDSAVAKRDPGAPIGPMGKGLGGVGGPTTSQSSGLAGKETPFTPTKTKI